MTAPSATSRTNEAAERLRQVARFDHRMSEGDIAAVNDLLDAALSEERRLTVERIVQRWHDGDQWREGGNHPNSSIQRCGICSHVLDEELAR